MRNEFEILEKKCKSYHLKKRIKIVGIITLFSITSIIALFYSFPNKEPKSSLPIKTVVKPKIQKKEKITVVPQEKRDKEIKKIKKVVQKKETPIKQVEKKHPQIRKDMSYSIAIDNSYHIQAKQKPLQIQKKKNETKKEPIIQEKRKKREITTLDSQPLKKQNSFKIGLEKLDTVKKMENKYKKEQNYKLALQIAQTYYDKKKYSKALIWTKKANILNKKAEGAWILFAKTEYAKGHRKRAIQILKLYLANASSTKGDELLLSWRNKK